MPQSNPRLCNRCRQPTRGPCPTCTPANDHTRGNSNTRGYDSHWRRITRPNYLRNNPLCTLCGQLATIPDHWPTTRAQLIQQGVTDPDAPHHLRPLCTPCHAQHGPRTHNR